MPTERDVEVSTISPPGKISLKKIAVESSATTDEDGEQEETDSTLAPRKRKVSIQTDPQVRTITHGSSSRIYCDPCDSCLVGEEDSIRIWI